MKFNLVKIHLIQQQKDSIVFFGTRPRNVYVILKLYSLLKYMFMLHAWSLRLITQLYPTNFSAHFVDFYISIQFEYIKCWQPLPAREFHLYILWNLCIITLIIFSSGRRKHGVVSPIFSDYNRNCFLFSTKIPAAKL